MERMRSAFHVNIDENETVDDLKEAIQKENANDLKDVDAKDLQLFMAKTEGGEWLKSKDPDVISIRSGGIPEQVKTLLNVEMDAADEIGDVFGGAPTKKTIHVLVLADQECLEVQDAEIAPHPSRKRRWDKLNEVLDKNKKAKKAAGSTGFSYVSFPEIDKIMPATKYRPSSKPIPDDKLDALHRYFPILIKAFGDIFTGKEAKRLHYLVPVLASVCAVFDGGVQILAEETVIGKRVHGDGAFEFVLKRGEKRVCIVIAKRDDIQQGLAQAYVGSEALADVEGLPKVYSIVTNFLEWVFSRSLDDKIERATPVMMVMENDVPAPESVKQIAGMIYSILSEDN
ncbi:Crinkler (CRN) [Phytophthora megakarya]|uniref:Crinkler (CRN) n=1 Tax=Phytophthora megakarya TaxID=4795 RepID=A0A225X4I0_9STRA|nr:Crinkler (CRN) [Phytophthora megakarya]